MGETGDTALTGRSTTQGGVNVLQGSGPSNITVWFEDVGPFGGNGEEVRRSTQRVPQKEHGEASEADARQDMGDAL